MLCDILARLNAASGGEWFPFEAPTYAAQELIDNTIADGTSVLNIFGVAQNGGKVVAITLNGPTSKANAQFLSKVRDDITYLLKRITLTDKEANLLPNGSVISSTTIIGELVKRNGKWYYNDILACGTGVLNESLSYKYER